MAKTVIRSERNNSREEYLVAGLQTSLILDLQAMAIGVIIRSNTL